MATDTLKVEALPGELMPPSPLALNTSRHGRGRHGGSFSKNKTRGRGYSAVEEREWLISRALTKVLKHNVGEVENQEMNDSWADCQEILNHHELSALEMTFSDIEALCDNFKSKFAIRLKPGFSTSENNVAANYLVRINNVPVSIVESSDTLQEPIPLSLQTPDLPRLIVYETSYANYPLILASGSIKRAGGQAHLSFNVISLGENMELPPLTADVSIYINLPLAMEVNPKIKWFRSGNFTVLTDGDAEGKIDRSFWKTVIARRTDIGVLFEDGQIKKEVPIGLRGKSVKAKKGGKSKGKGINEFIADENHEVTPN